jgi:hypothetical protein
MGLPLIKQQHMKRMVLQLKRLLRCSKALDDGRSVSRLAGRSISRAKPRSEQSSCNDDRQTSPGGEFRE